MTIGQKIKELRNKRNMSVDELAEKLGKNRATIYRYEKGDIGNLPLDVLGPLSNALETTPAYLMGWEDKNDKDEITIGELLKKMRTQRNMTIDEYAKEIGINPEILSKYESGEKNIPLDVVNAISEYYRLLTRSYMDKDSDITINRQVRFKEWATTENISPYKIAKRLENMGVPTYRGSKEWHRETIRTILSNPTYMGKVRWNDRMQVKTMHDGELIRSRPRSSHTDLYMEYDGKHKKYALVDEETYYKAQELFKPDPTKSGYKLTNIFAGLLRCEKCGKSMGYQSNKHRNGTVSARYTHQQSQKCKVKSIIASDVQKAVIHGLKLYIEDFEVKTDSIPEIDVANVEKQIETLKKEIKKIENKISDLFDSWEDKIISDNEFVQRKTLHNSRIENIRNQIDELEYTVPEKEEYEEKILLLTDAISAILNKSLDAKTKNEYLKRIIHRIDFSRENTDEFILDITLC